MNDHAELARIDTHTLLGLIGGFPEKQEAAREEIIRRIESLKDCAKAFADRGAELDAAQLQARKIHQENKRLRDALFQISAITSSMKPDPVDAANAMQKIARDAIRGEEE